MAKKRISNKKRGGATNPLNPKSFNLKAPLTQSSISSVISGFNKKIDKGVNYVIPTTSESSTIITGSKSLVKGVTKLTAAGLGVAGAAATAGVAGAATAAGVAGAATAAGAASATGATGASSGVSIIQFIIRIIIRVIMFILYTIFYFIITIILIAVIIFLVSTYHIIDLTIKAIAMPINAIIKLLKKFGVKIKTKLPKGLYPLILNSLSKNYKDFKKEYGF
jgi:hypothetical protein